MSDAHFILARIGPKLLLLAAVLGLLITIIEPTRAQTLTTLYTFRGGTDGGNPYAGLVRDSAGNLYGTTVNGGSSGNGTVFKISAGGGYKVLYSFAGQPDGGNPYAGLVRDGKGNIYGATFWGGTYGGGTVFKLTNKGLETVLFSFGSMGGFEDGQSSFGGVVRDALLGNLYGATNFGGAYACGTVFEITPAGSETVLYDFQGNSDGCYPESPLLRDSKGNLYGTTSEGGGSGCSGYVGCGTIFKVTPTGTETVLYRFGGPPDSGAGPSAGLIKDAKGNLYGTTNFGGTYSMGTVFELTNKGAETVRHNFEGGPGDGQGPNAGLILDKLGNLYGTTTGGGASGAGGYGWGTIFKIAPNGIVTVLYSFTGGADGGYPTSDLVMGTEGNLYGTTVYGGVAGTGCWAPGASCGTVFKVAP